MYNIDIVLIKNKDTIFELNGWTKIGDVYSPRGKWTIYKHGGTLGSTSWMVGDFLPSDESEAIKAYNKALEQHKRGGLWLISPDGIVTKSSYKKFTLVY